ncbi:MAG TPA: RNA-binding cell elongation regulator Jag/EloR [Dehalococcoidia bacterium]|nr:RNA-binding cell elongation regulator Jag/EloR [Dehalococcoidia bacterium]
MDGVEAEGRTVNEATEKALEQLGLTRADVDIEVLSEGRPRLLGFRGEPARVRVTPKPAPSPIQAPPARAIEPEMEAFEEEEEEYEEGEEELPQELRRPARPAPTPVPVDPADVEVAVGVLKDLIRLMGLEAKVTAREPVTAGDGVGMIQAVLDVEGEDLGILIGRRGQTLASLQYILNLLVAKRTNKRVAFGVDVDGYRRRREEALVSLAKRTASRVRGTGRSVTLEPMPPNERRIIHLALADDPNVMTVSIGEGEGRKVAITPTR